MAPSVIGPNEPGPSGDPLNPLEPLSSQLKQLSSFLNLVVDDPHELIGDFYRSVLSLPAEKRVTYEGLKDVVEEMKERREFEAELSQFPSLPPQRALAFLEEAVDTLETDLYSNLPRRVNSDSFLITVSALHIMSAAIEEGRLNADDDDFIKQHSLPIIVTLFAHLYRMIEDEEYDEYEKEFVEDISRSWMNIDPEIDTVAVPESQEGYENLRRELIKLGAVKVYANRDISVSKAAEWCGLTVKEFEKLLEDHDLEPRYGPRSDEELFDDGGLGG